MDTDKIIDFLKQIAAQIGPLGEQAYNIIKVRVIAESIGWIVFASFTLVVAINFYRKCTKWASNHHKERPHSDEFLGGYSMAAVACCVAFAMIYVIAANTVNLFSPDYATIERVVILVQK